MRIEVCHVFLGQGFSGRQFHGKWVSVDAVHAKFIMQVWPGCEARHAHISNGLPLFNARPCFSLLVVTVEMRIKGAVLGTMLDDNNTSIATLAALEYYLAITD